MVHYILYYFLLFFVGIVIPISCSEKRALGGNKMSELEVRLHNDYFNCRTELFDLKLKRLKE